MKKILFYYCLIISLFISISGILSSESVSQLAFQLLFLPVAIYFSYMATVQLIDKKTKIVSTKTNRFAIILTLVSFILLISISFYKVAKKTSLKTKISPTIVLSPSPKVEKVTFVVLKKEYIKDIINIRSEASKTGKIIGKMENKNYKLIKKDGDWFEIQIDKNKIGFVNSLFVEIKK